MDIIGAEENDDNKILIYVKGYQKCEWLVDILDSDDMTIETFDVDYKNIKSSNNLDIISRYYNTMRCRKHAKNCALRNVLKIYNW